MDNEQLIRRLALPRFLFRAGVAVLEESGLYTSGLATSLFQDSVEAFLRILAEAGVVNVGPHVAFDVLVDKVSESYRTVSEHKAGLFRLNKARVGFKHHGISVSQEDALHFRETARAFLEGIALGELGLRFQRASLVSVIGHRRTKNWLRKAQDAVEASDYKKALEHAAAAFAIYVKARSLHRAPVTSHRHWGPTSVDYGSADRELRQSLNEFSRWTVAHFEEIHRDLDLLRHGVDIMAYRRFVSLTPNVALSLSGAKTTMWRLGATPEPTKEDTEFCIDFVVDSALRIGIGNEHEIIWEGLTRIGQVKAEEDSVLRIYPGDDAEIIRSVPAEEILDVVSGHIPRTDDYVAVAQDSEAAFITADHVRLVEGKLR